MNLKTIKLHEVKKEFFQGSYGDILEPPKELIFVPPDKHEIENWHTVLYCYLQNPTKEALKVVVASFPAVGESPFNLSISGKGIKIKKPLPPPEPPPPFEYTIPAETQLEFRSSLYLEDYFYEKGQEAELEWWFSYWKGKKPSGKIKIKLP